MKNTPQSITLAIIAIFTILTLTGTAFAGWPIPHSGQTKCYDDSGEMTCPGPGEDYYGQDGNYTNINPRSYTKLDANGNDLPDSATSWVMVRDNVTKLIWEVKTDDGSVHDKDNEYTWYDSNPATNGGDAGTPGDGTDTEDFINAINAENFGGHSDWRLPTIKELASIVNLGTYDPAIDTEYFPNTQFSLYWSATTNAEYTDYAWCVHIAIANDINNNTKSDGNYVRAVRSGQAGSSDVLLINDGTVADPNTGLIWQQKGPSKMTWEEALDYCESLSVAGYNDWRIPSREELRSIVDYGTYKPAIDTGYFPNTQSFEGYWSATTTFALNMAWCVYFHDGHASYETKSDSSHHVRCVRSVNSEPYDPSDGVILNIDVNGDGKIGLEEAIYILQIVAGIRGNSSTTSTTSTTTSTTSTTTSVSTTSTTSTTTSASTTSTTIPQVTFPDKNLEALIREETDKPTGDILVTDLQNLTSLTDGMQFESIRNLEGIQYCTNLTKIMLIFDHEISDISALAGLTNLTELFLQKNQISDISALAGLTNLISLGLGQNQISDISVLAGLTDLQVAYLAGNQISDISDSAGLTNLEMIDLGDNQISGDISVLSGLTNLTDVGLEKNPLNTTSCTVHIPNLESRGVDVYHDCGAAQVDDTTNPTGSISGISGSYTVGDTVSYTVKGWDNSELSKLHFMLNDGSESMHDELWNVSGTSAEKSYSFQTSGWNFGTYYYALWVEDGAGNTKNYTGSFEITGDLDPDDYNPGDDTALCGDSVCSCTFPDVDQNAWYAKYVNGLCSAGILIGYQSGDYQGYFRPADSANLAEMLNVLLTSNDYKNVKEQCEGSDPWHKCYFDIAQAEGLSVYGSAGDPVKREEMIEYTAKIFFDYTGDDPVTFLKNKEITNGERLLENANRAEMAAIASLAAKEADKPIPYGLYDAPPPPDPDMPDPVIDSDASVADRARAELGKTGYPWTDSQWTYCARFVRMMYDKPAKWGTAYDMTKYFEDKGKLRTAGDPGAGAVICYKRSAGNGNAGHVSIATGDGTEIGVTSLTNGVTEKPVKSVGTFWGWISPSDFVDSY